MDDRAGAAIECEHPKKRQMVDVYMEEEEKWATGKVKQACDDGTCSIKFADSHGHYAHHIINLARPYTMSCRLILS